MSLTDTLSSIWDQILEITTLFVIPDWNWLISILPVLVFIGLIGPFITFLMLGIVAYQATKPRVRVSFVEGPRIAEIGDDGRPVYPAGLPHCPIHRRIYPSGTVRCQEADEPLAVVCPMCGLGREALIDTCSNCGLVLKVVSRPVPVGPSSGPKPGGAAAA